MSKEVIAQYLADMEKDDFVFVHPTTSENAGAAKEGEAENAASEVDMAKVVKTSSWADEVEEEEIMAAEDTKPESWAEVAAAAPPKPTTGRLNWILHRKLNYTDLGTPTCFQSKRTHKSC